jgi:hypothetical protein
MKASLAYYDLVVDEKRMMLAQASGQGQIDILGLDRQKSTLANS